MRFTSLLPAAFQLSLLAAAQQSGDTAERQSTSPAQATTPQQASSPAPCTTLTAVNPQMASLVKVCEFASDFRHNLPNFACEQTTTSNNSKVTQALVTFANGKEQYSNVVVNGKPVKDQGVAYREEPFLLTSGEFGSDLINLFTPPIAAEFKFRKEGKLGSHAALIFEFQLPADKNLFWTIHLGQYVNVKPALQGQLWIEPTQDRLLRLELEPAHLQSQTNIVVDSTVIDYAEVALGDAGIFLLPKSSDPTVCIRADGMNDQNSRLVCYRNTMTFHNCHTFKARARIVEEH
jgi:hypothetical protein